MSHSTETQLKLLESNNTKIEEDVRTLKENYEKILKKIDKTNKKMDQISQ